MIKIKILTQGDCLELSQHRRPGVGEAQSGEGSLGLGRKFGVKRLSAVGSAESSLEAGRPREQSLLGSPMQPR